MRLNLQRANQRENHLYLSLEDDNSVDNSVDKPLHSKTLPKKRVFWSAPINLTMFFYNYGVRSPRRQTKKGAICIQQIGCPKFVTRAVSAAAKACKFVLVNCARKYIRPVVSTTSIRLAQFQTVQRLTRGQKSTAVRKIDFIKLSLSEKFRFHASELPSFISLTGDQVC